MNTVVVGASSGLGRCVAVGLAQRGDRVAMLARRLDRLEDAVEEAGSDAIAIRCDVTDQSSCRSAVTEAADRLDGIDFVVYATGIGILQPMEDLDADSWARAFATNVTGASLITAAALPHLKASQGSVAYFSSISASMTPPWPGLGAYVVSKAALDKLVETWHTEHPDVGFTRVTVGDCGGGEGPSATGFADDWDTELATRFGTMWFQRGYIAGSLIDPEELVETVASLRDRGTSARIPSIAIVPRAPTS